MINLKEIEREIEKKELGTKYDPLIKQELELFGLEKEWIITSEYEGEKKELMEREEWVACHEMGAGDNVTFYFHKEMMKDPEVSPLAAVDHELAHLIINPFPFGGRWRMGEGLEETKVGHIVRACYMLREHPEEVRVKNPEDLREIIEKAKELTWLTENDWRVEVEEKEEIIRDGERLPAFAYSTYYKNSSHLALLGAREIVLEIDKDYLQGEGYYLPDVVLKEMWRVVLNPYQHPDDIYSERPLKHIMKAMVSLGWGDNPKRGVAWG